MGNIVDTIPRSTAIGHHPEEIINKTPSQCNHQLDTPLKNTLIGHPHKGNLIGHHHKNHKLR